MCHRSHRFTPCPRGAGLITDELSALPARAGQGSVTDNLLWALSRLATLREDLMPLELAMLTEPELMVETGVAGGPPGHGEADPVAGLPMAQPELVSEYLRAEQRLGRVRPDLDPTTAAVVLLVVVSGAARGRAPRR